MRTGSFILSIFISFLQVEILGEVSGSVFIEYSSTFQVCSLRVMVSTDWCQGRASLVNAAGPEAATGQLAWFCCFSAPGTEIQLRPRYCL